MKHQTNKNKFFQLLSITVFSSLLFVGVTGVTNAQAEVLEGILSTKDLCDNGLGDGEKGTSKSPIVLTLTKPVTPGDPTFSFVVEIFDDLGNVDVTLAGNSIVFGGKGKSGIFSFAGDDGGDLAVIIQGKVTLNKAETDIIKASGKLLFQDITPGAACLGIGKFKATTQVPVL